jgi:hypothetical protein
MEHKYYLPISSTSLAHYFGCACIKPSKYFDNKQEDLQDKFNDFLLVTTHLGTQQTDCCLELVFNKQETKDLIDIKNGFYLYENPLPITRVRKIYFTSEERKEQTITNINMSTAFVPDNLIEVVEAFDNPTIDIKKPQDIEILPYDKQIKTFNSFLGGFALMRLAGEDYMNYSENYFATLALFNSTIQRNLEDAKIHIDTRYRGAFNGESGFSKIIPYLNKTIDETDINNIAQEENQTIKKDKITRIIDLDYLDRWTYTVAVLNTYGVGNESKKKKIDELILSNFKSEIKPGKSEGIALCYGINRGYSVFSNKYSSLGKNEKVVKFQLNSQLDYYTIESVFQYAFNDTKANEFSYLDDWCPRQKWSKKSRKTDYKILDVVVIGKKKAKVLSKEYWTNLLSSFLHSKLFEKTLSQICQELGEIIYNDTKEEIIDEYEIQIAQKQEEIENLKAEQKKLLEESQKSVTIKEHSITTLTELQTPYSPKQDVKAIIEQYLQYKEKGKKLLEEEARAKGLNVKGKKVEEIILLLMTTTTHESKLELK